MIGRASTKRSLMYVIAAVVLVILAVFFGRKVYRLAGTFREVNAVVDRLPDLPRIRSITLQRQPAFPVVWAHRVNSVERAMLLASTYRGMEIDVVYDAAADYFDVGHPPAPSEGISLETMLGSVAGVREHYFWLDFKNLTEVNKESACARLVAIARKYDIVDRVVVESTNPRALTCFTDSGFYTSYYLFPDSDLSAMTAARVADYYAEVKANLLTSKVNALSATYRALPFIEKYFPEADILLWYLDSGEGVRYHAWVTYLRLRPRVKVILVSQPSRGYR